MSFSKWLKIDLHIHSKESNKTKINDYDGTEYTADQLISTLEKEKINIFSITDHNTLNVQLYKQLENKRQELIDRNMNFLVGTELDIKDKEIFDKEFHCLFFFDTDNLSDLEIENKADIIKGFYLDNNIPNLRDIFEKMQKSKIRNFILIPHYNNKNKGIKENKMQGKVIENGSPTLHLLNISVFDAFEDSNNIEKIKESFKKYSEVGCDDLPILIFSDNHNLNKYPEGKSGNKSIFRYILGNVKFPFNSMKLAFKEADLRMGFSEEYYNCGRNIKATDKYIKSIVYNDKIINLSPYQNTIIGGFGSGKSLLKDLIINGKDGVNEKYKDCVKKIENFKLEFNDKVETNSLREKNDCELLILDQNEEIFYTNTIEENYKKKLEEKFTLKFPGMQKITLDDNKRIELEKAYENFFNILNETIGDVLDYQILSFKKENYFQIIKDSSEIKLNLKNNKDNNINNLIDELTKEKNKKVFSRNLYSEKERMRIEETSKLITKKNNKYDLFLEKYEVYLNKINEIENNFNKNNNRNDYLLQDGIKIETLNYLRNLTNSLKILKEKVKEFKLEFSELHFNELIEKKEEINYESYKLIARFSPKEFEYEKIENNTLNNKYRDDLFFGLIKTKIENGKFHRNKEIRVLLNEYCRKYFFENFSEAKYDIEINNKSIMKMSAGEKANNLIILLFEILKTKEKEIVILMDQPEDNLDNKSIYSKIVNKILELKKINKLPQTIFITHNSNIAISADSENIIVAMKKEEKFEYNNSGIENKKFSEDICKILEGGTEALRKRGIKFSVPFIKEYMEE